MSKVYRVYCNGFTGMFLTLAETQGFINTLRGRGCVGHEVVINVGSGTLKAAIFQPGKNERRAVLGAEAA